MTEYEEAPEEEEHARGYFKHLAATRAERCVAWLVGRRRRRRRRRRLNHHPPTHTHTQ